MPRNNTLSRRSLIGSWTKAMPRSTVAATKPARSPTTPPPSASTCVKPKAEALRRIAPLDPAADQPVVAARHNRQVLAGFARRDHLYVNIVARPAQRAGDSLAVVRVDPAVDQQPELAAQSQPGQPGRQIGQQPRPNQDCVSPCRRDYC